MAMLEFQHLCINMIEKITVISTDLILFRATLQTVW